MRGVPIPGGIEAIVGPLIFLTAFALIAARYLYGWLKQGYKDADAS